MESQEVEQKGFWRTLPGIITGIAGIITAVTALIVALTQTGIFHTNAEERRSATNISTEIAKSNETQKTIAEANNKPVSEIVSNFNVKFSMTSIRVNKDLQYQILQSVVKPKDPQNSILTIKIRCVWDGSYGFNFWSASFKLSIDDLPTAPLGYYALNELVESHTVKDGIIEFEIPDTAKSLKFLIYDGDNKIEVPLSLTKKLSSS